jgi:hypothetical protein
MFSCPRIYSIFSFHNYLHFIINIGFYRSRSRAPKNGGEGFNRLPNSKPMVKENLNWNLCLNSS